MTATLFGCAPEVRSFGAATEYLYSLPRGSNDVGLARAQALFDRLGSPQDAVRTVHVAGTAGKGSVSAFVAAILTAHGFRVGTHLSPHVRSILERFHDGGRPTSAADFVTAVDAVAQAAAPLAATPLGIPTFFEACNAVAFQRFAATAPDYAVVETGIGGLLDATNTMSRSDKVALVSRIGIDHTRLLGDTVADIARHKAGILPFDGDGIVVRHHQAAVRAVIESAARQRHCRLDVVDPDAVKTTVDPDGTVLHIGGADYRLGLQGHHQGVNAALALRAVQLLARRDRWTPDAASIRAGLAQTWLPGRFERHSVAGRDVVLDGAHNNVKAAALADTLGTLYPGTRVTLVLAAKADKDFQSLLAILAPVTGRVVATRLRGDPVGPAAPSMPPAAVAALAAARGIPALAVDDPTQAVRVALDSDDDDPVVVTGSFLHLAAADRALH